MGPKHTLYFAVCVAVIMFCAGFGLPAFQSVRVLWYYPVDHRWAFEASPSGAFAIDWYGRNLLGAAFCLIGFGVAYWAGWHRGRMSPRSFGLWAAWSASAVVMVASLYAYQLAMRHPVPPPLPVWYVPK